MGALEGCSEAALGVDLSYPPKERVALQRLGFGPFPPLILRVDLATDGSSVLRRARVRDLTDTSVRGPADTDTRDRLKLSLLSFRRTRNPADFQPLGGEALDRENLTGSASGSF